MNTLGVHIDLWTYTRRVNLTLGILEVTCFEKLMLEILSQFFSGAGPHSIVL